MSKQLAAFALVAEEYEKTGDPLRGLKPLFAPMLHGRAGDQFDPEKFAADFTEAYGLQMSPFVASALAERMHELGLLDRHYDKNNGHEYFVSNFEWAAEPIAEAQVEKTIEFFVGWAEVQSAEYGKAYSRDALEDAVLTRLARPEFASVFTLQSEDKNARLRKLMGVAGAEVNAKDEAFYDYLVARFILHVEQNAPAVFDAISLVSYGALIADAVAGLAVTENGGVDGKKLRLVLDAPLLMDLLDLNSPAHKQYAFGLVEIAKGAGLMLATFDHCLDEVRHTIQATLDATSRGEGYGPMANRLRTEPGKRLSATLIRDHLRERVADLDITILRAETYRESRFEKWFPEDRVDQVRNAIGDLHENLEARIRDAESVAAVARLKQERSDAEDLFKAGTIFITRNSVLCKRVNRALSRGRVAPSPTFAIATDGQIAGVLWFVSGMRGVELSRRRLIANCSAAILPKRDIISRISSVLEGIQPELREEFETLMADSRASLCVMRLTAGDVDLVDRDKSIQLIEEMRAEIAAPAFERAIAAEERADAAERLAHELASDVSNKMAMVQGNISAEREMWESRIAEKNNESVVFNSQIAQLQYDLEKSLGEKAAAHDEYEKGRIKILNKVDALEKSLAKRRRDLIRLIRVFGILIAVAAAVGTFFWEDRYWVRVTVLLVSVFSIGVIESAAGDFMEWLAKKLTLGDQRAIELLKSTLE